MRILVGVRKWRQTTLVIFLCTFVGLFLAHWAQAGGNERPSPNKTKPAKKDPVVAVLEFYPGMAAEVMEREITSRLERWCGQATGVVKVESKSMVGISIVRIYFRHDIQPATALKEVTSLAISTLPTLPPGSMPPFVAIDPTASMPLGAISVSSSKGVKNPEEAKKLEDRLSAFARSNVRQWLLDILNVSAPTVYGGRIRHLVFHFDMLKLQARNLSPADVAKAISSVAGDASDAAKAIDELPVGPKGESQVYLRDVGLLRKLPDADPSSVARLNGRRVVCLPVWQGAGTGRTEAAKALDKAIESIKVKAMKLEKEYTHGVKIEWHGFGSGIENDAGLLTILLRAPVGAKFETVEKAVAQVERTIQEKIPADELGLIFSEIGLNSDQSVLFGNHGGPEDATIRIQLASQAKVSADEYARRLRRLLNQEVPGVEFSFHAGLYVEPSVIARITGASLEQGHKLAEELRRRVSQVPGAVDVHIVERLAPIDAAPGVPGFETAGSWIDPKSGIRHILETRGEELIDKKSKDKLDKPLGKASRQISHVNMKRVIHVWINTEGRKASELAAEIERIRSKLAIPEGLRVELTFTAP